MEWRTVATGNDNPIYYNIQTQGRYIVISIHFGYFMSRVLPICRADTLTTVLMQWCNNIC